MIPHTKTGQSRTNACIVEAARSVFLRQGFETASMDAIAREADVSKATVYAHFAGKEALFVAIMQRLKADYQRRLVEIATMDGDGFAVRLTLALTAMAEFLIEPATVQMFRVIIAESGRFPDIALNDLRQGRAASQHVLAGIFAKGVEDGELELHDCRQAASFVMAVLRGGILWDKLVDATVELSDRDVRYAVDTVVDTVLKLHKPSATN